MMHLQRISMVFSKIKQLKISIVGTEPSIKVKSQTSDHSWQVKNALENVLASLVACEVATLKDFSRRQNVKVESIKFNKVESSYDLANYMKGGPASKLNEVTIDAQFQISGSQQDLDKLHKKVENSCPVYQMLNSSGVKITNTWKKMPKK